MTSHSDDSAPAPRPGQPQWQWVQPTADQIAKARSDRAGRASVGPIPRAEIPPLQPYQPRSKKPLVPAIPATTNHATSSHAGAPHQRSRRPRYIPRLLPKKPTPPAPPLDRATEPAAPPRSALPRLCLLVEGQTEEAFVRLVLATHLRAAGVEAVPRMVVTSRSHERIYRGGLRMYEQARTDLRLWMEEEPSPGVSFTTMFDLYALPRDFPGFYDAATRFAGNPHARVEAMESSFRRAIAAPRFIPYIQLYEYEALVLAAPESLTIDFPAQLAAIRSLVALRDRYPTPEHINDGPETAPSKRIIHALPNYRGRKATAGPLAAQRTGLKTLRARCPHFHQWLTKLEALAVAKIAAP